jgi:hypothetical protein
MSGVRKRSRAPGGPPAQARLAEGAGLVEREGSSRGVSGGRDGGV